MTLYLMRLPVEETIREFFDLARELHEADRFFPDRRAISPGPLAVVSRHAANRVRVSAAAVAHRPNRGVYVVATKGEQSLSETPVDELIEVPGVAGIWQFSESEAPGKLFADTVTICYLDEDPISVAGTITDILRPGSEHHAIAFAGPMETVVPWSWDWFDEPGSEPSSRDPEA
jgi:hypothetical protein